MVAVSGLLTIQCCFLQVLTAAERKATLLADDFEAKNKPLQIRIAKLEKKAIVRVCGISGLQHGSIAHCSSDELSLLAVHTAAD